MGDLDLKSINLGEATFFRAENKRDAVAFARKHGWPADHVRSAANRFWRFWVIGQGVGADTIRLLATDGTTIDLPHPGFW